MVDQQTLIQVFQGFFSNDQQMINQGQQFIQQNCLNPNYCVSLMILADSNSQQDSNIRLSAIANLKNTVENFWLPNKNYNNNQLLEQEKATLRQSILDALIRSISDQQICKVYKKILSIIINYDYPAVWPDLLETVINRLAPSQNMEEIQGCLFALEKLYQKYEFEIDNRAIMDHIINKSIVILQNLAGQMIQNYSEQIAPLLKSILKIYFMAIDMQFPIILAEQSTFQNWMVIFKILIGFNIPQSINQSQNPDKNIYWKNRKWCFKILIKIFHKYCFKNPQDRVIQQISCLFLQKYAVPFFESVLEILFNEYYKGQYVSDIVINNCILFIYYSLGHDETFNALHPVLEKIVLDICIPLLSTTPEDFNLYNQDPEDYIRKDEDNSILVNKNTSIMLIKEACKITNPNNESYLEYVLSLIVNCLDKGVNPRNNQNVTIAQKEGLFQLMGVIREQVYEEKNLTDQLENIIQSYIVKELNSEANILKARTCWLLGKYGGLDFKNPQNLSTIIAGICQRMIDGDLVVRVKASIALQYYIDQEGVKDLVRPGLSDMLSIYIKLMQQIDNENLVCALECIVENFTNEITPFAYDLANHLSIAFYRYKEKDLDEDQAGEDGELPAAGCLQAINQILESPLEVGIYSKMENDFLLKLIIDCLTDKDFHYLEEGFSLLNTLLFKSPCISNNLWIFYPFICYAILGFPPQLNINSLSSNDHIQLFSILTQNTSYSRKQWVEALDSMIGPMKNYFQKGRDVILTQSDPFNQSLIQLLFEMVKITYSNSSEFNEVDQMLATSLLIGFVENMQENTIDQLLPEIVSQSIQRMGNTQCKPLKVVNIEVVALCIYYNPLLTLQILESNGWTSGFFREYFDLLNYFKADYDKQRMLVGISSVFKLNENQLPSTILQSMQGLMQYLVKLCMEIVELREKGEKEDNEEQAEVEVQQFHQQLQQMQYNPNDNANDDDDENDEDYEENVEFKSKVILSYTSPLELFDEILYFEGVMASCMERDNNLYQKLIGCLSPQETNQLQNCVNYVKSQLQQQS
ncbi:importin-beta amine-terminal domain protein (macronuclear) [Tetrahymena thermophila SB210]|uniref:Importin-beta amine-terminal domain protein n=1 Tax=Tetrahymena thermophila (strain SB210) TaxID=312017 RepID=Q23TW7_TETTS|nr:importin-beta amine-terminal domain protein [Tetrahymena thermophila SB210]EAS00014.1 importin-beta amine-terminal domain protein [Tetrahymena thermophila SB210]|eukprot:XP_001020259.1 importin-beta amine-terminal domain protein [Tetrahymena thermophila SB210]